MEHKMIKRASLWIFPLLFAWCVALCTSANVASADELIAGTPSETLPVTEETVDTALIAKAEAKLEKCEVLIDKIREDAKRLDKKKARTRYLKLKERIGYLKSVCSRKDYMAQYWKDAKKLRSKGKKLLKKIDKGLSSQRRAASHLRFHGVVYSGGRRYTWYSQNVLSGGGLSIPGRHVGNGGLVMDKNCYVCVASSDHSRGTVLKTPYGLAKVYDCGCPYGTVDVYTNW